MKMKQCSSCPKIGPIYKNITVDGDRLRLCKDCAMKYNAITKDSSNKKLTTPIPKFSNKRSKQEAAYNVACKVFKMKAENKYCPVMSKLKGTTVLTTDVHHINGRENEMLLDQEFWLAVSREGHDWIHAHPEIAREEGWLI